MILNILKSNASDHGVEMVLIMIDDEGYGCASSKEKRKQFAINHHKWINIAHYFGCHAIRTNCRGGINIQKTDALNYSAESYNLLLQYAEKANINVLIENHGGV